MKKIDWKSKLTSRKFWAAIVSAAASIAVAFGAGDGTVAQITAIIMAGATVIAYIIGEGLVDASRNKSTTDSTAEGNAEQKEGDGKTIDETTHDTPSETASDTAENKQNSD